MKIEDSDGKIIDCYDDDFVNDLTNKIRAAIYKFKSRGYAFKNDDDAVQDAMVWIWKNLPKYNKDRKSKLSTWIYILIRTSLINNSRKFNQNNRKDPFDPLNSTYLDIWSGLPSHYNNHDGDNFLVADFITDCKGRKPEFFNILEIRDFLTYLLYVVRQKKYWRYGVVLEMMIKNQGDKKEVAKKLSVTNIRINQIISEIKKMPEFQKYFEDRLRKKDKTIKDFGKVLSDMDVKWCFSRN